MQANSIKHQALQIDGKLVGILLSKEEFQRVLKIIESVSPVKSKPISKKKKSEISKSKINELKLKNKNGKFIPLDEMKKRIGI